MLDTRTLSPIERLLTGSSSALEGGAGHIWDMYSGCQHEASTRSFGWKATCPRKWEGAGKASGDRSAARTAQTVTPSRWEQQQMTEEWKEEFPPFIPVLAWEGWRCLKCTQSPKIAHSDNTDCAAGKQGFPGNWKGPEWSKSQINTYVFMCVNMK